MLPVFSARLVRSCYVRAKRQYAHDRERSHEDLRLEFMALNFTGASMLKHSQMWTDGVATTFEFGRQSERLHLQ